MHAHTQKHINTTLLPTLSNWDKENSFATEKENRVKGSGTLNRVQGSGTLDRVQVLGTLNPFATEGTLTGNRLHLPFCTYLFTPRAIFSSQPQLYSYHFTTAMIFILLLPLYYWHCPTTAGSRRHETPDLDFRISGLRISMQSSQPVFHVRMENATSHTDCLAGTEVD